VKHKKIISIKDPHLRTVRYNLRMLIIKAAQEKRFQLSERFRSLIPGGDMERMAEIHRQEERITHDLRKSICMCKVCGSAKEDMIYSPVTKTWFCVYCYERNQDFYRNTKDARLFP